MSSSELSDEDIYDFENYAIEFYEEGDGPPLIKKRSRLLAAVVQNQVDILAELLDSPKWYKIKDKFGENLIQIAITRDNKEVFDYLLSVPDFPIEYKNQQGLTALGVALSYYVSNDIWMGEHYAYELIKKGANIDIVCADGASPLHCALDRSYIKVAKYLIEKGVDLNCFNDCGESPLQLALSLDEEGEEIVSMLLVNGARFDHDLLHQIIGGYFPLWLQENFFFYVFDRCVETAVELDLVLKLANYDHFFKEFLQCKVKVLPPDDVFRCNAALHSMSPENLRVVLHKYGSYFHYLFKRDSCHTFYYLHGHKINIKNFNVLLECELKAQVIQFIATLDSSTLFQVQIVNGLDLSSVEEAYCFLLSYGLPLNEKDLQVVYIKFGYCRLFKILLHMDFVMNAPGQFQNHVMPTFIYDVSMDLEKFFESRHSFDIRSFHEMFRYFVHPKMEDLYADNDKSVGYRYHSRQVPLLMELARNEFRKHFVKTFNIKNSRWFYTLLDKLPISNVYKKVISFETKLY